MISAIFAIHFIVSVYSLYIERFLFFSKPIHERMYATNQALILRAKAKIVNAQITDWLIAGLVWRGEERKVLR